MSPEVRCATRALAAVLASCLAACAPSEDRGGAHPTPEAVQPLPVGASVPSVVVHDVAGEPVDLAAVVREHGALLVFYRGGW